MTPPIRATTIRRSSFPWRAPGHALAGGAARWVPIGIALASLLAWGVPDARPTHAAGQDRPGAAQAGGHVTPAFVPNDKHFGEQWNLAGDTQGLRLPPAWDITTGEGTVVAVVGTGIRPHADLDANVLPGYDFIADPLYSHDGNGRDPDPADYTFEHGGGCEYSPWGNGGTAITSVVAAVTNNAIGIAGVAPGARVVPVRAMSRPCESAPVDVADAITWAAGGAVTGVPANANPADVILVTNASREACPAAIQAAIDFATAQGSVVVGPAGDGYEWATWTPGSCANLIVANSVNPYTGEHSITSNFGTPIDLIAPGQSLPVITNDYAPPYDGITLESGTALAAAHVAGLAALMQSVGAQSPAQVEAILKGTARPMTQPCPVGCGAGLATALPAVQAMLEPQAFVIAATPYVFEPGTDEPLRFEVHLSRPLSTPFTFDIATRDGTAHAGADYQALALAGQVIPAGQLQATFEVVPIDDSLREGMESFDVVLSNAVGAPVVRSVASQYLFEQDAIPLQQGVWSALADYPDGSEALYRIDVPAGATGLTFRVLNDGSSSSYFEVGQGRPPLQRYDGLCEGFAPLEPTCEVGSFAGGAYFVRVQSYGNSKDVRVKATYTAPPSLSVDDSLMVEGDTGTKMQSFLLRLSRAVGYPVVVSVHTRPGSAGAGTDFTAIRTDVTIPAYQTGVVVSVPILGDTLIEPRENYFLQVDGATLATIADGEASGWITDNDQPLLSVTDATVVEGDAGTRLLTFTVRLDRAAGGPVTYDVFTEDGNAQAGIDYDALALSGQVIPAGQLAHAHSVVIRGDTDVEQTEMVLLKVRHPGGAGIRDGQGLGYVINDDGPALSLLDGSTIEAGASAYAQMRVPARLSQPATVPVTFAIRAMPGTAQPDSDYRTYYDNRCTIPAGVTSTDCSFAYVLGDARIEPNESLHLEAVKVSGASRYDWLADFTIVNDDGPTLSVQNSGIKEGDGGTKVATFLVTLSQAASVPVTYSIATGNGTATAGSDYVAKALSGETIPAGMTSKTFGVVVNGDLAVEGNETFKVSIADATGATIFRPQAVGTITDND